jgi:hypothetical protein
VARRVSGDTAQHQPELAARARKRQRRGSFNGNLAFELSDFEATASKSSAGTFGTGRYRADLLASAHSKVKVKGHTEFRLRFVTDDDNDGIADYLNFYTGNLYAAAPQLIVTYYVP